MRKKSKRKPRPILQNAMGFVMERVATLTSHKDYLTTLGIKNHGAMYALTQGHATLDDINTLIQAFNITEALYRRGFGTDYKLVVANGQAALKAVRARGAETGRFILKAEEMLALNSMMELHEAQLNSISVFNMEQAILDVRREQQAGKMIPIVEKKDESQ